MYIQRFVICTYVQDFRFNFDREVSLGFGIQRFQKVAGVFGDRQRIKGLFFVFIKIKKDSIFIILNLDFQWINYEQEPAAADIGNDIDNKFPVPPSLEEEIQSIYKKKYARSSGKMKAVSSGIIIGDGGRERIIKATGGRKDRHSKVNTSKGPRDRRVRLSAHTAIQFYDVQDRLGYDRPSKAVDWLITKAKQAIDNLSSPPPPPPPPQQQQQQQELTSCSSLLMPPPPPPPDSMMKSLFPMRNNLSRTGTGIEGGDLGLSLQTMHEQFDHHEGFIFNSNAIIPRQQLCYNSPISNNFQVHSSFWNNNNNNNGIEFPSNQGIPSQPSLFSVHFGSSFQVPARIHGEDDHPYPQFPRAPNNSN